MLGNLKGFPISDNNCCIFIPFSIIGEYVLSIHGQVRKRPPMFEIEKINFENSYSKSLES